MFHHFSSSSQTPPLSDAQLRLYASETSENFRWVSKLVASRSPYTLTSSDLASIELQHELSELGQFAEIAHGHLSPDFVWRNISLLCQPDFPLDGYDALQGSSLISAFRGAVAGLQGYVAFRETTKQLIVAFSGTSAAQQTLYNLDVRLIRYPSGDGCAIHAGFWKMYNGVQALALEALSKALCEYAVEEIVFTGHSLGAVMCYLLMLDVVAGNGEQHPARPRLSVSLPLKLAVFGSPRVGNLALSVHWQNMVAAYCKRDSKPSINEYSVKAFNDGVPAIPLQCFGYRHFARNPLYFAQGRLYHVPPSYSEYSVFEVDDSNKEDARPPVTTHPRGGHLYYSGRDMDQLVRRMDSLDLTTLGESGWEERYRERLLKNHDGTWT